MESQEIEPWLSTSGIYERKGAQSKYFTVVLADLRGYGDSSKPKSDPKHTIYSKREIYLL